MTDTNIYSAPAEDSLGHRPSIEDREHFLSVAKRQKCVLISFLFYFAISIFSGLLGTWLQPLLQFISLSVFIAMIVFNISLVWRIYGLIGRICLIGLSVIPVINLMTVLAANSRANHLLKTAGYRVGLLGADIADLEKPG